MYRGIFIGIVLAGAVFLAVQWRLAEEGVSLIPSDRVVVGGTEVRVAIADNPAERAQGLSGVTHLSSEEGMLFVFPGEGMHAFWMKDMHISIDIIWLSRSGDIVHLEKSVSPESYPHSFLPTRPAYFVLEVPAGFSDTHGIKIGDRATLPENIFQ